MNLVPLAFPTKICKHFSSILPRDTGSAVCEMIFYICYVLLLLETFILITSIEF